MAIFEQERHVELQDDETEVYAVTSTLVSFNTGELPHANVFVVTINTREDPKDDTLARVATVADLTELPQGRDAGLASTLGIGILYLISSFRLEYGELDEAIAAMGAIKDRVNALILSWQTFDDEFSAPDPTPAVYILPTSDLSQFCTLVETYKTAKQNRYQKQLTQEAATAAQAAASADYVYKYGLVTGIESWATLGSVVAGEMSADKAAFDVINAASALSLSAARVARDALDTFHTAAGVYYNIKVATPIPDADDITFLAAQVTAANAVTAATDAADTFQIAVNTAVATAAQMAGHVTDANALTVGISALKSTYTSSRDAAGIALTSAEAALITANQVLTSAQTLEGTTLAAVLAISPDFDKYTIPLLDDVPPTP